jgi:hypothetical protein
LTYRPGYLDLCRLFTTEDLRRWYRHIALAEIELRREFDRMKAAGLTPRRYPDRPEVAKGRSAIHGPIMANVSVIAQNFTGNFASINGTMPMEVSLWTFLRASLTLGFQRGSNFSAENWRFWCYRLGLATSSWALLENRSGGLPGYRTARLVPNFFVPFDLRFWTGDLRIGLPEKIVESPMEAPRILGEQTKRPVGYVASDGVSLTGRIPDWERIE